MAAGHLMKAVLGRQGWANGTTRHVYLEMCYMADSKGVIRQSVKEIAGECVYSVPTVWRAVAALQEMGLLARIAHSRYALRYPVESAPSGACPVCARPLSDPYFSGKAVLVDGVWYHPGCAPLAPDQEEA